MTPGGVIVEYTLWSILFSLICHSHQFYKDHFLSPVYCFNSFGLNKPYLFVYLTLMALTADDSRKEQYLYANLQQTSYCAVAVITKLQAWGDNGDGTDRLQVMVWWRYGEKVVSMHLFTTDVLNYNANSFTQQMIQNREVKKSSQKTYYLEVMLPTQTL